MINFRYHLVTICAIFIALALGLLLGAAITSSDLAQSTSDDLMDNMLTRYDEINNTNAQLERELAENVDLAESLFEGWSRERLTGRTIVVLLDESSEDAELGATLATDITTAGGSPVLVSVHQKDFGQSDATIRTVLQQLVGEIEEQDYQQVLAEQLVKEWSYVTAANIPGQAESSTESSDESSTESSTESSAESSTETSTETSAGNSETPFPTSFIAHYPLTRKLIDKDIISIETDYRVLIDRTSPAAPTEQLASYQAAQARGLPYNVNGLIDCLPLEYTGIGQNTQRGLELALAMQAAAANSELTYPTWLKPNIPSSNMPLATALTTRANYYVVLVQSGGLDVSLETQANEYSLSCVTSASSNADHYSIIALLTGASAGIYGENRSEGFQYAPLPQDNSGRAFFK